MGRMARHQAALQRLAGRTVTAAPAYHGGLVAWRRAGVVGIPRRTRSVAPGRRRRNTTAVSPHDTGVGPDQPRSQPARLTRTATSPATVLIHSSTRLLTSPESFRNRVISGAEVRTVSQC